MAIGDCHPDDARQVLTAALCDLSAGDPKHTAFGDIREDARWWAGRATPAELQEYVAEALRALGNKALCLEMRKRLFWSLWRSFTPAVQSAFLERAGAGGAN